MKKQKYTLRIGLLAALALTMLAVLIFTMSNPDLFKGSSDPNTIRDGISTGPTEYSYMTQCYGVVNEEGQSVYNLGESDFSVDNGARIESYDNAFFSSVYNLEIRYNQSFHITIDSRLYEPYTSDLISGGSTCISLTLNSIEDPEPYVPPNADPVPEPDPVDEGELIRVHLEKGDGTAFDEELDESNFVVSLGADNTILSIDHPSANSYDIHLQADFYKIKALVDGYVSDKTDIAIETVESNPERHDLTLEFGYIVPVEDDTGAAVTNADVSFNGVRCPHTDINGEYACIISINDDATTTPFLIEFDGEIAYNASFRSTRTLHNQAQVRAEKVIIPVDTDSDGLPDARENELGTDPDDPDSDDDGLTDFEEVELYATDPNNADTDGGTLGDAEEIADSKDPLDPTDDVEPVIAPLACQSLELSPDTVSITVDEENAGKDLDLTVELTAGRETSTLSVIPRKYTLANLLAVNSNTFNSDLWSGTIKFESTGIGTFTNEAGLTGFELNQFVNKNQETLSITYNNAEIGDEITVSVNGEETLCEDKLKVEKQEIVITPTSTDTDGDGLTDEEETDTHGTDPEKADTDDDELNDYEELFTENTDPLDDDTDDDGLKDGEEVNTHLTDPTNDDTDNGGTMDGNEITDKTDPLDPEDDIVLTAEECEPEFKDIVGHWAEVYVTEMFCKGIVQGRSNTKFVLNDDVTQAEVLKILLGISGESAANAEGLTANFRDVNKSDWFYPWVALADEKGMLLMPERSAFQPHAAATRGRVMVWAARLAEKTYNDWEKEDIPWTDLSVYDPHTYALLLAHETKVTIEGVGEKPILEGYTDKSIRPYNTIARSEMMALADRIARAWYPELLDEDHDL